MTAYPAAGDYYKAVQAPARTFTVPKLQAAQFVWDSLGPTLARGSSAVVFQASVEGKAQALRCYIRNDASSRGRYSALNVYLADHDLHPYVSGTTWLEGAIMVNRSAWPVLTMEWINGRTLNEYVDFLVSGSNAVALTTLAARWRDLVALLQRSEFGHGDLQHGNIMVDQEGQLRLVDFDGVWIPQLAGQSPPTEFGHPNYQHPGLRAWDRWIDTFSAMVIYLSLIALGRDPALWLALYNSKNLLFAKNDFFPPFQTEVWKQLAALGDPQVNALARRLQECCAPDWVSAGSLEMTLEQQAPFRVPPPIPPAQRWWEKPSTGTGVSPGAVPSRPRPQPPPGIPSAPGRSFPAAPVSPPAAPAAPAAPGSGGVTLPTPPPLSTPLSMAGTGPMPQLSQKMVPPGDTIWWAVASGSSRPGPPGGFAPGGVPPGAVPPGGIPPGGMPPAPMPRGYAPYGGQVPPGPGPSWPGQSFPAPSSPAPAARRQPSPLSGAIALGLGIVLLIAGASAGLSYVVIIGLVAGAWGIWRLVTTAGSGTKPPGSP